MQISRSLQKWRGSRNGMYPFWRKLTVKNASSSVVWYKCSSLDMDPMPHIPNRSPWSPRDLQIGRCLLEPKRTILKCQPRVNVSFWANVRNVMKFLLTKIVRLFCERMRSVMFSVAVAVDYFWQLFPLFSILSFYQICLWSECECGTQKLSWMPLSSRIDSSIP